MSNGKKERKKERRVVSKNSIDRLFEHSATMSAGMIDGGGSAPHFVVN
jgi:hypothetical protein